MRTKYTVINLLVSVGGQLFSILLSFISRMFFIHYLSAEYLGLNGLFTDVLGILNLAELGIGTAMIFSMYEPAAREDKPQLVRLMNLYKLLYRVVAGFVLLVGLALLPFLNLLIKDSGSIEHLRLIYMLYVLNSAGSYLLSYKDSIYIAHQKAYIKMVWVQVFDLVRLTVQIAIIILTHNFILYLIAQFVAQFIPNIIISFKVDKEFPYLKECRELPSRKECLHILRNVGAMSIHKVSAVIVRNTDSLIMSKYIGLTMLGIYSNYKLVLNSIGNLVSKICSSFGGSIGNLSAIGDGEHVYKVYRELDFMFFLMFGYLTGGLAALFNPFISLFFGSPYCMSMATVLVVVADFYISGLRKVNLLFREAKGLFWNDRYKAIVEAILNLVISLLLVKSFGVAGILGGTVISSLLTCVWVEPYILMRYGFEENWHRRLARYFADYILRTVMTVGISATAIGFVRKFPIQNFGFFILYGMLYTVFFGCVAFVCFCRTEEFRFLKDRVTALIQKRKVK